MPPEKSDLAYLWDMQDAAEAVIGFLQGKTFEDYMNDRMLRGAVERHIEIIGEAANRTDRGFRARHGEIPWRPIIAQRNVLAHEYGELKHELIWNVAQRHLPVLVRQLREIMDASSE